MAKIEELTEQIGDARLRKEIASEVKKLKSQKKFGLVFEEHLPETVRLPSYPIRLGELVAPKGAPGSDLWLVKSVNSKSARCIRPNVTDKNAESVIALDELVVVKRFGEPIYPALLPVDRIARGGRDKPWHTLINADNFHALQLLLYCYEGKIDVIYIDPPFNTGARDWKYNNAYVDSSDVWRHSKWLSMMKRRLLLAKRLLKKDGVLIVAIDDNEMHHLQMLLEATMPDRDPSVVAIVHNPRGNISNNFAYTHEYAIYMISRGMSVVSRTARANVIPRKLRRWGHNSTRLARPTMFYPIYVKDGNVVRVGNQPPDDFHPKSKNVATKN
jgi:adenine-specific DNA-methyltransferase